MKDKRKTVRVSASLEVSFRKAKSMLGSGGRIKDISENGICIPSNQYFPINSLLEIEIHFEDFKESIKSLAKVVRITNRNNCRFPFELGLEFLDLPSAKWRVIQEYIDSIKDKGGDQDIHWIN